jgi:hypothetical protein
MLTRLTTSVAVCAAILGSASAPARGGEYLRPFSILLAFRRSCLS